MDRERKKLIATSREEVENWADWYRDLDDKEKIRVYRAIVVDDVVDFLSRLQKNRFQICHPQTKKCYRGIGKSWAKHKENAVPYNTKGGDWTAILSGKISKKDIDLDTTVLLEVDVGEYNEDELRLYSGNEIWVDQVEVNNPYFNQHLTI